MSERRKSAGALERRAFLGGAAASGLAVAGGAAAAAKSPPKAADLHWVNLTSERMPKVIKEVGGVCLVPWGCLERHGPHLPLGTDTILGEALAGRAAELEPAVVFPTVYFGQIAEARHCPGTISLDHDLLLRLVWATLDEIGRNGFTKIVIVNFHGGNNALLDYLLLSLLQHRRPYVLYSAKVALSPEDEKRWKEMAPGFDDHAGVLETSCMMHMQPETVHLEDLKDPSDGQSRGRLKHLGGSRSSFWWYADFPTHFAGDPRQASPDKGAFWMEACAKALANEVKKIKGDNVSAALSKQFFDAADRGGLPAP